MFLGHSCHLAAQTRGGRVWAALSGLLVTFTGLDEVLWEHVTFSP